MRVGERAKEKMVFIYTVVLMKCSLNHKSIVQAYKHTCRNNTKSLTHTGTNIYIYAQNLKEAAIYKRTLT